MKYIIIGNGVAGTAAALNIRKTGVSGDITILTDESYPFYSRIRLIEYLADEIDEKKLTIYKDIWYEQNRIRLLLKSPVDSIDRDAKEVVIASGQRLKYDRLLLATGGISFVPPIPGFDKKGVFTLRTLKDAIDIKEYAKNARKVLLIGGGVLGLEAGNSLRKSGHPVSVVEFSTRLLPRQMDPEGAEILKAQMEDMGFTFYLDSKSKEIAGMDKVEALLLEDGREIKCDMIIISAGIRPNARIAEKLGLKLNKGLPVNDRMETEISGIYAAGDLIEHRGFFYGIWPASAKQGEVAGINMAGGDTVYNGTIPSNVLKIAGVDLAAAGDIDAEGRFESIVKRDKEKYIYKKLVINGNRIIGCIFYGDPEGGKKAIKAIDKKRDIGNIESQLRQWNLEAL
ncbi:MAG TPA: NAD(P)/FAD-dependent oxidoreductase [Nitrospirae bacterium]|nr:NAD(P)/FAD-dependent oxidoreductase [Nitrospirota bacterium]